MAVKTELERQSGRSAGGKIGQEQMFNETVAARSLKRRLGRLGRQNGSASDIRR